MTADDQCVRDYLQAAHNRGGTFHMAMLMMAQRIELLEDRLTKAGRDIEPDPKIEKLKVKP